MKEKIVAILLFLIPSVDFLPFWNPAVTGRSILFEGLITAAAAFLLFYYFFFAEKIRISIPDVSLFILFVYISVTRFLEGNESGFSIRYYEYCGLLVLYLVVRASTKETTFLNLVVAAILGGSLQLVVGWLQLFGVLQSNNSLFRVTGSFFNSGPYAGYLASVFAISLSFWKEKLFLKYNRFWGKMVESVLVFNGIGLLMMIPLLKSRACLLAVVTTVVFIYSKEIRSFLKQRVAGRTARLISVSLAVCLLFGGLFLLVKMKESSSRGRWMIGKNVIRMIGDRPFAGVGYDRFKTFYMDYQASYFSDHPQDAAASLADNVYYAFCEPLQFVVENGLLGLIPVAVGGCFLIGFIWKRTNSSGTDSWLTLSLAGLLSILVFSLFSYTADILPIKINGFFLLAVLVSQYNGKQDKTILFSGLRRKKLYKPAIALLLLSLTVGIFQTSLFIGRTARGFWERQNASALYIDGQINESMIAYAALRPLFSRDGDFLVHYGKTLYFAGSFDSAIAVLDRARHYIDNTVLETSLGDCYKETKRYSAAENAYTTASLMMPGSFYNKYLLVKLYQTSGQKEKAINMADEIRRLPVKIPSLAIDSIKSDVNRFLSGLDFQPDGKRPAGGQQ